MKFRKCASFPRKRNLPKIFLRSFENVATGLCRLASVIIVMTMTRHTIILPLVISPPGQASVVPAAASAYQPPFFVALLAVNIYTNQSVISASVASASVLA